MELRGKQKVLKGSYFRLFEVVTVFVDDTIGIILTRFIRNACQKLVLISELSCLYNAFKTLWCFVLC